MSLCATSAQVYESDRRELVTVVHQHGSEFIYSLIIATRALNERFAVLSTKAATFIEPDMHLQNPEGDRDQKPGLKNSESHSKVTKFVLMQSLRPKVTAADSLLSAH